LVQDQIDKCTVVNPITGTVLAKLVQPHEIVGPGKPLYKLADLTQIYLKAYISEPQLGQVKLAQQVNVQIDLGAGVEDHSGTISWISSEAEFTPKIIQTKEERVNLVYAIKVRVENLQGVLKLGMPGEVYF
jgi:HlyD family secretion protein